MIELVRTLRLRDLFLLFIGSVIGSGIFRTPGPILRQVGGSVGIALLVWIVGGVLSLMGALTYAELAAANPEAGGLYCYIRDGFGRAPAFLYGWTLVLVIATGAIAGVSVIFADYTLALVGLPNRFSAPLAVAAIVFLSGINYLGVRPAAITQNIFTILKLAALAVLIAVGILLAAPSPPAPAGPSAPFASLGSALVPIMFTYGGWQQTNFIAEEIIEPEKNLPRALVLGVGIAVAVYLLTNIAYLRILGVDGLAASTAPAADTMERLLGPMGGKLIAAGIAISTFGFLNLVILVTPRVLQAMAADGVFFRRLAVLHPVYQTPTAATMALALFAAVLTLTGTFRQLVDYVTFGDWLFFASVVATLYVYRARDRGVRPAFAVPGYPVTPAVFVLVSLYIVVSAVTSSPRNSAISAGLIALGIPVFFYWRSRAAHVR